MEKKIDVDLLYSKIKEKDIKLNDIANITGISSAHLCLMFKQKRNITVDKLNKIIEATKIDINDITK